MKFPCLCKHVAVASVAICSVVPSFAQSSVTLFGTADGAYRKIATNGVGSVNGIVSGGWSSTRWGLRGSEDLGGGLSTSFWLESAVSLISGAGATTSGIDFTRRSTVSLTDKDLGEIRLGRDYIPTHWVRFDPFGFVGIGSVQQFSISAAPNSVLQSAFGSNPTTAQRASNAVEYFLPVNKVGIDGSVQYAFRENSTAALDAHHTVGGRIGYTWDRLYLSAASMRTRDTSTSPDTFKDTVIGAIYEAGFAKISAAVRRYEFRQASQTTPLLAASVPFGPHEFKAMWMAASENGRIGALNVSNNRADQLTLGYVYNLSKNTRVYATAAKLRNQGASRFALLGSPATTGNGQASHGFEFGLNKSF